MTHRIEMHDIDSSLCSNLKYSRSTRSKTA